MKRMHIISNSHLDREHRHEFQETRLMMAEMLDDVIEMMENDPEYKYFTLDGQAIVLDDYLEIHPHMKDRLIALTRSGRIQIGPWYSLVDCYAVDPESIIRNLLTGSRVCREFGESMPVGYSIFSFGQMAQLPQIYAGFGIHDIMFYKGANAKKFPQSEFIWRSPDGSEAFATRLGREKRWNFFFDFDIPVILGGDAKKTGWQSSYINENRLFHFIDGAYDHLYANELNPDIRIREDKIDEALDTVLQLLDETASKNVLAAFDGTDFTSPLKQIPEVIRIINARKKDELELVHSTPAVYFNELKKDLDLNSLLRYEGEMRFGPVNSVHSETMGTNTDIKQAIWKAENAVIHILEPLTCMVKAANGTSDRNAMNLLWKYLLETHAHDSIHGSGDPKIKTDNLNRLRQVMALSDSLIKRTVEQINRTINFTCEEAIHILIINPTPFERTEILRLNLDLPQEERVEDFTITDDNGHILDYYPLSKSECNLAMVERHNRPKSVYSDRREILLEVADIPSCGYKTLNVFRKKGSAATSTNPFPIGIFPYHPIAKSGNVLDNGKIRATLENGSISVYDYETGLTCKNLNAFTSIGSSGDFWVHREPDHNTQITSIGGQTSIELVENSSLRATYRMTCLMDIPKGLNGMRNARSKQTVPTAVQTEVTLQKDKKRLDFKTTIDNQCGDQLFTVSFPTGIITETASWEAPYEIRSRAVDQFTENRLKKGDELERQALQGFIDISDHEKGFALFTKGIREAGTTFDQGAVINLTLFRACSNTFPIHNDLLIGFSDETSQCLNKMEFEYSVLFHDAVTDIASECRKYQTEVLAVEVGYGKGGSRPQSCSVAHFKTNLAGISAMKCSEDERGMVIRIFNPTKNTIDETVKLSDAISSVCLTNMNEDPIQEMETDGHTINISLPPYKIITLKIIFAAQEKG